MVTVAELQKKTQQLFQLGSRATKDPPESPLRDLPATVAHATSLFFERLGGPVGGPRPVGPNEEIDEERDNKMELEGARISMRFREF